MPTSFVLADFLPYLLNRAGVSIGQSFARDIASLDVSLPMWRVMVALWQNGDQRLGDLAERTSIDLSTLSRLLVGLQRKRFIVRRRSGADGRALSVSLTTRGRAMTEKIIPLARHYEAAALRGLDKRDVRKLKKMLNQLYANIQAIDPDEAAHSPDKPKSRDRQTP